MRRERDRAAVELDFESGGPMKRLTEVISLRADPRPRVSQRIPLVALRRDTAAQQHVAPSSRVLAMPGHQPAQCKPAPPRDLPGYLRLGSAIHIPRHTSARRDPTGG